MSDLQHLLSGDCPDNMIYDSNPFFVRVEFEIAFEINPGLVAEG
jgi:hypothetical protein